MIVPFSAKAHRTLAHIMRRDEKSNTPPEGRAGWNERPGAFPAGKDWAGNPETAPDEIVGSWGERLYRRFRRYFPGSAHAFPSRGRMRTG
jgi:hypothetical protein